MSNFLEEIVAYKREEVERLKASLPLSRIINVPARFPSHDFCARLSGADRISIIAEIKKTSPSKGILIDDFDPVTLAKIFEKGGAAAISILTDEKFFQGDGRYIGFVKEAVDLPILCKDFIIDPYQLYLAKHWGADAVLLIAACLRERNLTQFLKLTQELALAPLVEVHNRKELETALSCGADLIGVNNRDLNTFEVDLAVCESLAVDIPDKVIKVVESGVSGRNDIERLRLAGYSNFLIGEAILRSDDISGFIKGLWQ